MKQSSGGSFCHLWWKHDRPPCSEAFLVEGVANFLAEGGKKTPLTEFQTIQSRPLPFPWVPPIEGNKGMGVGAVEATMFSLEGFFSLEISCKPPYLNTHLESPLKVIGTLAFVEALTGFPSEKLIDVLVASTETTATFGGCLEREMATGNSGF